MLALLWLLYNWAPFVPSLDIKTLKENLKPLLQDDLRVVWLFQKVVMWLVIFHFLEETKSRLGKVKVFPLLVLGVLTGGVFITGHSVGKEHVLGGLLALPLWFVLRHQPRPPILAVLLGAAILATTFWPFELRDIVRPFQWVPFSGALTSNLLVNSMSTFIKLVIYGSFIWLLVESGLRLRTATVVVAAILLGSELSQVLFYGPTPEITDPLLAILLGLTFYFYQRAWASAMPLDDLASGADEVAEAQNETPPSAAATVQQAGDIELLKLNLHLYQSNFLALVEKRLGISPSRLCAELIAVAARRKRLQDSILNEFRGGDVSYFKLRKKTGTWVRYKLELEAESISDLDLLAHRIKESPSYTLRHLIDEHIGLLREQVRLRKMALSLWEAFVTFIWHQRKALAGLVIAGLLLLPVWFMSGGSPTVISAPEWAGRKATIVFDGHSHTTFSDGELSPAELVELAIKGGCDALAITDHSDVKTTVDTRQLQEFATLRSRYPDFLLLGGVELNMPSYGGREHVNVIVDPSKETSVLPTLAALAENTSEDAQGDAKLLAAIARYRRKNVPLLMFYNHPSRKAASGAEVTQNFLRWDSSGDLFNAIAGAPGHQNAEIIGDYKGPEYTVDHWDPVAARVGGVWDQLLAQGYNVGGAIASSDYHNGNLDKAPCAFSRIHVSAPDYSYQGLIRGMQAGTYWSDHGGILDALKLTLEIADLETPVHPGSVVQLTESENTVLVSISLRRGKTSMNDPLTAEIISNCSTGIPEIVYEGVLGAEEAYHTGAFRVSNVESELESCFVRARVRLYYPLKDDLLAYTNAVRILL